MISVFLSINSLCAFSESHSHSVNIFAVEIYLLGNTEKSLVIFFLDSNSKSNGLIRTIQNVFSEAYLFIFGHVKTKLF